MIIRKTSDSSKLTRQPLGSFWLGIINCSPICDLHCTNEATFVSWKSYLFISIMITSLVLTSTVFWVSLIYHENRTFTLSTVCHFLRWAESSVGKKMAAAHFTKTPCEPNTVYKVQRKLYFSNICFCANDIVYSMFEAFRTFLFVFMSVLKVFVRYEVWVDVPVAGFFPSEDSCKNVLGYQHGRRDMYCGTFYEFAATSSWTWQKC